MKKAFTMIELIFVIVIVGILSSIVIPMMFTTRDDAKISNSLAEISLLVSEISSYYTTKNNYNTGLNNINNMTYVRLFINNNCLFNSIANEILSGNSYTYCTDDNNGNLERCVLFTVNNIDGNLTVRPLNNPSGNICRGIQQSSNFMNNLSRTFINGGNTIKY